MSAGVSSKVVVITGASSGIGEATAKHVAAGEPPEVDVNEILLRPASPVPVSLGAAIP